MGPKIHSNSGIFERRGDPWSPLDRESRREYGRGRDEFENPDMDRWTKAEKAPVRKESSNGLHGDLIPRGKAAPKPGKSRTETHEARLVAAGDRLRKALKKAELKGRYNK